MFTMGELVKRVVALNSSGKSWGEITAELYPNERREAIRPILWRMVNDHYYPQDNRLRERLHLAPLISVEACPDCGKVHLAGCPKAEAVEVPSLHGTAVVIVVGSGNIPPGSQVLGAVCCSCGASFVSNNPRRSKCYLCAPVETTDGAQPRRRWVRGENDGHRGGHWE
jgi:hypothetical protein